MFLFFAVSAGGSFAAAPETDAVKALLSENNTSFQTQELAPAGAFPQNIIIRTNTRQEAVNDYNGPSEVYFIFTQDLFLKKARQVTDFIDFTKAKTLPYNCYTILTAEEEDSPLPHDEDLPDAEEIFAGSISPADSLCVILIREGDEESPSIFTESREGITPLWLVRAVTTAYGDRGQGATIKKTMLYDYKPELFENNFHLTPFLEKGIPAVEITLGGGEDLDILSSIQDELVLADSRTWDSNYNFISIGSGVLYFNEAQLIALYIAFAIFIFFSVCFYSFSNTRLNEAVFSDFSRTWFFIPVYALAGALVLSLFQAGSAAGNWNIKTQIALKVFPSLFVMTSAVTLQHLANYRTSLLADNFHIIVTSAINALIFPLFDLSLLPLFLVEYAIAFWFRKQNKFWRCILCIVLMIVPLVFAALTVLPNLDTAKLSGLVDFSFAENIALSLALLPLLFLWTKALLLFKRAKTERKMSRILVKTLIISLIITAAAGGLFCFAILRNIPQEKDGDGLPALSYSPIELSYQNRDFFDFLINNIEINAVPGFRIARCKAIVQFANPENEEDAFPVYNSNFAYTIDEERKALLQIPDYPEDKISLSLTSAKNPDLELDITIFVLDERGGIYSYSERFFISSGGLSGV